MMMMENEGLVGRQALNWPMNLCDSVDGRQSGAIWLGVCIIDYLLGLL